MEQQDLHDERRKEIFLALVQTQDGQKGVNQSRRAITSRFGVSKRQILAIEREGIEHERPPAEG